MSSINFDFCGASGSGKTSVISRFTKDCYKDGYNTTTGVHMGIRRVCLDNKQINLYLWDNILYNRPESYPKYNFRTVDGLVFVLDCTDTRSVGELLLLLLLLF